MKLSIVVILLLTFAELTFCMKKEELLTLVTKILSECKVTEGATEDDFNKWMIPEMPTTRTGDCMLACIHERFGWVEEI